MCCMWRFKLYDWFRNCCIFGEYGKNKTGTLTCETINDTNIPGVDVNY